MSVASLLFFSSCFEKNNYHYPEYVYFPKEGGKMIIQGDNYYTKLYIKDKDGSETIDYTWGDHTVLNYEWLTVMAMPDAKHIKIIVAPSDSKKKRKLRIEADFGPEYAEINVIQAGN